MKIERRRHCAALHVPHGGGTASQWAHIIEPGVSKFTNQTPNQDRCRKVLECQALIDRAIHENIKNFTFQVPSISSSFPIRLRNACHEALVVIFKMKDKQHGHTKWAGYP
jgi:hypothetical protein